MSAYFNQYLSTYHRVRMGELLEYEGLCARKIRARASLVVNPLTGMPYAEREIEADAVEAALHQNGSSSAL